MTAPATTRHSTTLPPPAAASPAVGSDGHRRAGLAACLVSATGFGALPVLGKAAYDAGLGPLSLLWGRFALAALAFWLLVIFVIRPARPPLACIVTGFLMGAVGYALEAGLFFVALERIDASLVELLLYAYPAIVTAVALGAGREAPGPRLLGALALATLGVLGVFAGSLASGVALGGLALGLGAPPVHAGYVLAADRVEASGHPVLLAAPVAPRRTASVTVAGLARGGLPHPRTAHGWARGPPFPPLPTAIRLPGWSAALDR